MIYKLLATIILIAAVTFWLIADYAQRQPAVNEIRARLSSNGRGSKFAVCDETGDGMKEFSSVDFTNVNHDYMNYYLFNIENPQEYLDGNADAEVVEKGPYALRKFTTKYDITFKKSTVSTRNTGPNAAIEYKVAEAYVALDKEVALQSNMRREDDLSLTWSNDQIVDLPSEAQRTPSYLSFSDEITNLSQEYLKLLGQVNDEMSMILRMVCSPKQVENILTAGSTDGKAQCTANQLKDPNEDCSCCMLDDTYAMMTKQNGGSEPAFTNCDVHFDESDALMSTLNYLAYLDGGVVVKESGDMVLGGNETFTKDFYGLEKYYSPVMQRHSVNELLFGFPSATLGLFLPHSVLPDAYKANSNSLTMAQVAAKLLTGELDDTLPVKIGNSAKYTKDVGEVCSSKCTSVESSDSLAHSPLGHVCDGKTAERHTTNVMDEIFLGGIDCAPYSFTYATKMMCTNISQTLDAAPNTPGYERCVCADGSDDWRTKGCCLSGGKLDTDLTGWGCLHSVPGKIGPNYLGKTGDVGRAVETWISRAPADEPKFSKFMCPAVGFRTAEQRELNYYEQFESKTQFTTYYDTGRERIQQRDAESSSSVPYVSNVTGNGPDLTGGLGFSPRGGEVAISNGFPLTRTRYVFDENAKRPFSYQFQVAIYGAKGCGTEKCLSAARFHLSNDEFTRTDSKNGKGLPYNGLQPIGHLVGSPMYLHRPFYLNGDEELYSQKNNSYLSKSNGNGVKIYHAGSYGNDINAADPGSFTVGGTNENFKLVDKTWVDGNNNFQSFIDIEGATGITTSSNVSYGFSQSIWECNPKTNAHCKLAAKSQKEAACYEDYGTTYFDALSSADKSALNSLERNEFTYPCSATNLISPKVTAGKIIPTYWFDSTSTINPKKMDPLVEDGEKFYSVLVTFLLSVAVGEIAQMLAFWLFLIKPKKTASIGAET